MYSVEQPPECPSDIRAAKRRMTSHRKIIRQSYGNSVPAMKVQTIVRRNIRKQLDVLGQTSGFARRLIRRPSWRIFVTLTHKSAVDNLMFRC